MGNLEKLNIIEELVKKNYQMINVSDKCVSFRRACVSGSIQIGKYVFNLIEKKKIEKGNVLALAEIAGINAAKKTSSIILLCHQINIENVIVSTVMNKDNYSIDIYCIVFANSKTGVEMEAMVGVSTALSTIYDLTKKYNPHSLIKNIELIFKDGGENGLILGCINKLPNKIKKYFIDNKIYLFSNITTIILSISKRSVNGIYEDYTGELIKDYFVLKGGIITKKIILPDDDIFIEFVIRNLIKKYNPNLIILAGGTGLAREDVTINALLKICNKNINGISEFLRNNGSKYTQNSWLSSMFAGLYNKTFILALPGNPVSTIESLNAVNNLLLHSLKIIKNS